MYQPPAKLGFKMSNSVKILKTYARTFFTGSASNFSFFQWMKSFLVPSCRSVLTGAGIRRDECPRGWGGTERSCSWLCLGLDCGVGPDNGEAPGGWHLHLTVPCTQSPALAPHRLTTHSTRFMSITVIHTQYQALGPLLPPHFFASFSSSEPPIGSCPCSS